MDSTWESEALPILETIARAERDGTNRTLLGELTKDLDLGAADAARAAKALYEAQYIGGRDLSSAYTLFVLDSPYLRERGMRAVGQWPSERAYESLVQLLESQVAAEGDDDRKSKLAGLLKAVRDVGVDVAGSVLSQFAARAAGLS